MSTWYPAWRNDGPKSRVTLRHVVTMTAGISDFPQPTGDEPDWLAYLASRPLASEPGTEFAYSTFGAYLLTGVVKQASRIAVDDFARANLFAPLGITHWEWFKDGQGNVDTGGGLYLRPRDMLRIGCLVREGGVWKGRRVVSSAWLTESARTESPLYPCYAMEWWVLRDGCDATTGAEPTLGANEGFYADGYGGQYITVVPSTTLLGVRTTTPPVDVSEAEYLRINFGPSRTKSRSSVERSHHRADRGDQEERDRSEEHSGGEERVAVDEAPDKAEDPLAERDRTLNRKHAVGASLKPLDHLVHRLEALGGILGQPFGHEPCELGGGRRLMRAPHERRVRDGLVDDSVDDGFEGRLRLEGVFETKELVEDDAEGIDVRPLVDRRAMSLLG
jgi:CubicO group peptidase (beta-lactamase class C family)